MQKLVLTIILSFGLFTSYIHPIGTSSKSCDFLQKIGIGTAIGSAVALGGYSLYKLGQWFFEKTDEQVYNDANEYYNTIVERYNNLCKTWQQEIYCSTEEGYLSRLCKPIQKVAYSIDVLLTGLQGSIQNLNKEKSLLLNRIAKLDRNHASFAILMNELVENITALKKSINRIYQYLNDHRGYFNLYTLVKKLNIKYKQELALIPDYEKGLLSEQIINKKLAQCILCNKVYLTNADFPYLHYIDEITSDIAAVNVAIKNLKHKYPHISPKGHKLRKNLVTIKSLVVLHDKYHTELCEQERNKLEQQRIAQEQQRISLERQKMWNCFFMHSQLVPIVPIHFHMPGLFYPCITCGLY